MDKKEIRHYAMMGAEAFLSEPFYLTIVPEEKARKALLYHLWVIRLTASVNSGDIIVQDEKRRGICIWRRSDQSYTLKDFLCNPHTWMMLRYPQYLVRAGKIFSQFGAFSFEPGTMEIEPVFVDPKFQKQGIATKLITEKFPEFDAAGIPLGLVTQSETNVGFYEKLGFQLVKRAPCDGFVSYYMVRKVADSKQ